MANAHIRIRPQSPMFIASEIAPKVQKLVLLPTKPKMTPSANASQAMVVEAIRWSSMGKALGAMSGHWGRRSERRVGRAVQLWG